MSWKSKLKTVGSFTLRYVLTLGIGAIVDRYASKKVAGAVKEVVGAIVAHKPLPLKLQQVVGAAMEDHPPFGTEVDRLRSVLGPSMGMPPLPAHAAALRSKARKK